MVDIMDKIVCTECGKEFGSQEALTMHTQTKHPEKIKQLTFQLSSKQKRKIKYWIIGILASIVLFLLFGIPTNLIPNPWFNRMVEKTTLDYFFLVAASALLGSYIGVHFYKKNVSKTCDVATYSGGIGSFLAFSCPICNKILILLFGATALLTYFEPYRPYLGAISISLLNAALYSKLKK
jgi:uncharacterized membrane protein